MSVAALHDLADRLGRLRPDSRNYERFVEQRSELVAELRTLALPPRCACRDQLPVALPPRPRPVPVPDERVRRWSAVLRAREAEIRELRRLLGRAVRPSRPRPARPDPLQLGLPLPGGREAGR